MKTSARWLTALALGVALLITAPLVYAGGGDKDRALAGKHRSECDDGRSDRDGRHGSGDLDVVGLTSDQTLICFEEDDPDDAENIGLISGLNGDDRLVGIDYRPATGDLYGLGNNGGVYMVDDRSAQATLTSRLDVALDGTSFGVDFNPTVDRLRIVSDTGQNLRDNVDANGDTLTDTTLSYPGPPPMTGTGVTGAAYTNNDADPNTATTLYDIDSMLDQTVIQSPANSGLLAATGKLGVDTGPTVGFDIYSKVRGGTTVDVNGLASLTVGGQSSLYEITLFNGRADSQGAFSPRHQVIAIAIPLDQR